jgi:hypothetical protein
VLVGCMPFDWKSGIVKSWDCAIGELSVSFGGLGLAYQSEIGCVAYVLFFRKALWWDLPVVLND